MRQRKIDKNNCAAACTALSIINKMQYSDLLLDKRLRYQRREKKIGVQ
jgi:hypothetical protein